MKSRIQLLLFIALVVLILPASVHTQHLVGYWENWPGNNYVSLEQVDGRYSVVNISFAVPASGSDHSMTFNPCCDSPAAFKTKIQQLQANGVKVNISIGGAATPIVLDNVTERDIFISTMNTIINTYEVDGIDIDLENSLHVSSTSTIANPTDPNIYLFIQAVQQLAADYQATYGRKMFIGAAPETAFVQGGMASFSGDWGSYLPVLDALRSQIDILHVQLYNSGSMYGLDMGEYFSGTADFIVSQVESVIRGFTVNNVPREFFQGFPPSKVAVGLPACYQASVNGNGYTAPAVVKSAIDYLLGNGPKPGNYTLVGGPYPDLGGMMTWSLNYDTYTNCNPVALTYASNYELIFQTGNCDTPNLGTDMHACDVSFPVTLQTATSAGGGVTYTWTNLTTGDVILSNDPVATSLAVSAPGLYRVQRRDGSCSKTDDINIEPEIPQPNLSGYTSLCTASPLTLSVANAASYPGSTSWQWFREGQPVGGASTSLSVSSDGTYSVEASYGACVETNSRVVSTALPTAVDDCVGVGESATISLQGAGAGPYYWYESASGGASLGTGTSFTTPNLTESKTYYAENAGQSTLTTVGPPTIGHGLGNRANVNIQNALTFDVHSSFTLHAITVYPLIWGFTHPFDIEIRDANNNLIPNGGQFFDITHPGPFGNLMPPIRLEFSNGGVVIPAGNSYKIVVTSAVQNDNWGGSITFPISHSPYFTFTGTQQSGWHPAFHDWELTSSGCAHRVPVLAEVDPGCAASLPVSWLSFTAQAVKGGVQLAWETANEHNNKGFFIERKQQGEIAFSDIGWVGTLPTGSERLTYAFMDADITKQGLVLYRLRQVDFDGEVSYSEIRQVTYEMDMNAVCVFPVPTTDELIVTTPSTMISESATAKLMNMQGQVIFQAPVRLARMVIPTSQLLNGVYLLQWTDDVTEHVFKVIVCH